MHPLSPSLALPRLLSKGLATLIAIPLSLCFFVDLSASDLDAGAELPHPEEIRLMDELAAWTGETPTSSPGRPFSSAPTLASSVDRYAQSFALFRQVAGPEGRSAILETIPFGRQIERVSLRYQVDPLLVAAIIGAESSFDPTALSPVGAQGLMQLMPDTARFLGASEEEVESADPLRNLELGALYVRRLLRLYGDDIPLMLAAYNSGPGNVRKFGGIPPFSETRNYVERVLGRYIDLQNAAFNADRFAFEGAELAAGSS